ncbi:MAG: hypothetical protein DRJ18_01595 [Candidatus Methanomethylicota archaeon]|nr:MAG: hypothetical protein DRJ18_01595 [Candidatus Verstraetearchaeota archaeon]
MSLLENALVVLFDGNRAYHAYTDSEGKVTFIGVPSGTYKVIVYKEGYGAEYGEVVVNEDKSIEFYITKPVGVLERIDGVGRYILNLTKGNMLLEFFDTKYQGIPEVKFIIMLMKVGGYGRVPYVMTLQGESIKIQSLMEVEAIEINTSFENKLSVEVKN